VTVHASRAGEFGQRTYIDVKDVADALLFLLEHQPPTRYPDASQPDRWNITGPHEFDNLEIVEMIGIALGKKAKTEVIEIDQADLGHRYALDGSKLAEAGWEPSPYIERALRRIVNWTSENRLWLA
jgi:nucleoside-diphosphate-sugar epimerase